MHKYRLMINPYAIEKWVNDMACQGWHLKNSYGFGLRLNEENQVAIFIATMNWSDLAVTMKRTTWNFFNPLALNRLIALAILCF